MTSIKYTALFSIEYRDHTHDRDGIHIQYGRKQLLLASGTPPVHDLSASQLLTDNPGDTAFPTLTVLAAFSNPESRAMARETRVQVLSAIRSASREISSQLKLKPAALLAPQWLAVDAPADLKSVQLGKVSCPKNPIRILLDTSLPRLPELQQGIRSALPCPIEFAVTNADTYFREFRKADVGIAWFTPDFLDLYDVYSPFDCSGNGACYFKWKDPALQSAIDRLRTASLNGLQDKNVALLIERLLHQKGYAAPISDMNWWIRSNSEIRPIHPAGLFQVHLRDFL